MLLGRYLDEEPRNLRFSYSQYRKPSLAGSERSLCFNLSHSDGLVLFAIACGRDVGVDVERLRELRDAEAIARRFFSVSENAALRDLPPEQRLEGFYRCWTRKEAFIKALGEGLSRPLDSFDVSIAGPAALLRMETQDVERWTLHDVMPGGEYTGALAVEGDVRVTCYHYHSVGVALPQRAFA
jgi:4'-phosphopantetheinyl transferase